jgi:ADP-ribose pyrophosphatase YjhB (NUDIX family)
MRAGGVKMASLQQALETLDEAVPDPSSGLPEEMFVQITRFVPMINVDLLIKDSAGRLLLTWREDEIHGKGWHVPGGIIRYKESIATRIQATADRELSASVTFEPAPLAVEEIVAPDRRIRGHFISLVFNCTLITPPDDARRFRGDVPQQGDWAWFQSCPDNMIPVHFRYRRFFQPETTGLPS